MANRIRNATTRLAGLLTTISTAAVLVTVPAGAQPTNPSDQQISLADSAVANASDQLAGLAVQLSEKQQQIAELDNKMGALREAVNKALVDLHDAQATAELARQAAQQAKTELTDSQADVDEAQQKLDEVARSTYRDGGKSGAITSVSGAVSAKDSIDRQSFLRVTAQQQEETVKLLEQARTTAANNESKLRQSQQQAEQQLAAAQEAEAAAQAAIAENSAAIAQAKQERDALASEQQASQAQLDAAKLDAATLKGQRAEYEAYQQKQAEQAAAQAAASAATAQKAKAQQEAEQAQAAAVAAEAEATGATGNDLAAARQKALLLTQNAERAKQVADDAAADADNKTQLLDQAKNAAGLAAVALVAAAGGNHTATANPYPTDPNAPAADTQLISQGTIDSAQRAVDTLNTVATGLNTVIGILDGTQSLTNLSGLTQLAGLFDLGDNNSKIERVIARAESQIGVPYAWGGGDANGPTRGIRDGGVADAHGDYNKIGFDCSGLVLYAFAGVGIALPHYTGYQYQRGRKININEIKRGDLIFYGPNAEYHVAIYLGNGQMIEAPESGSTVKISPVRYSGVSPYAVRLIG